MSKSESTTCLLSSCSGSISVVNQIRLSWDLCNVFCVLFLETRLGPVQFCRNTLVGITTLGDCQGSGPCVT